MHVLYANQQDDLDPMNGTVIDGVKLAELLDGRRKKPPFLARLSGENGFELMIGIGGNVGCAQYSRSDGELPYLMAESANSPIKSGGVEFLTANTATPIPARQILRFGELKEIALHFLETGERSNAVCWRHVGATKEEVKGRWRPREQQQVLRLLTRFSGRRVRRVSLNSGAADGRRIPEIRYWNHQSALDPLDGATIVGGDQLAALLESLRKNAPFVAELSSDNGFWLLLGVGSGIGFAQYRPVNDDLPYFMALPAQRNLKGRHVDFLVNGVATPIPGRFVLSFDELREIALHFLETGERSPAFSWELV